jgi:hypothetical protein
LDKKGGGTGKVSLESIRRTAVVGFGVPRRGRVGLLGIDRKYQYSQIVHNGLIGRGNQEYPIEVQGSIMEILD